ncbi:MAG: asparaginase [Marinilabiliales bacterium]|nr:asparaginase [Marinilabiliales bacterium]
MEESISILIIYTGGTIGMVNDPVTGSLVPIDFRHISDQVPELRRFGFTLETVTFDPVIDSSDVSPDTWVRIAETIAGEYDRFDGFVVLHGTDTMAYSASALSFMLSGLEKPVIFTGAQLPIGVLRTDGKENLITAIEIAAARENGLPLVPEVCIYFENKLITRQQDNQVQRRAFQRLHLAQPATAWLRRTADKIQPQPDKVSDGQKACWRSSGNFDTGVAVLRLFPGYQARDWCQAILAHKRSHGTHS